MWLDSIMTAAEGTKFITQMFNIHKTNKTGSNISRGLHILGAANSALIVDYRLLCCLLFAEHALEIDFPSVEEEHEEYQEDATNYDFKTAEQFRVDSSQMSGWGFIFGFLCIFLQLICGLQYLKLVKSWSNIFPIIADVSVIILGFMMLKIAGMSVYMSCIRLHVL